MSAPYLLDRPEIVRALFHPRTTGRTSPPPGARDIDIPVADQVTIGCRLFTAAKEAPVILFFHGNGETVPDYDDVGPLYTARNLNFLIADFRGYGWSSGSPSPGTMIDDGRILFRRVGEWLAGHDFTGKLFLMGRSLGSAVAIDLAAFYPDEIKGLVIESGFADTIPLAATLGIDLAAMNIEEKDCFNNASKIRQITRPTLILHGRQDTLIPLWQAEKLHTESGARNNELQIVPGADHNTLILRAGPLYFDTIRRFVGKITGSDDWRLRRKRYKQKNSE